MNIQGHVDRCDQERIEGWITVPEAPEIQFTLEIRLGDHVIGHCRADQYRDDLRQARLGDGYHAFSFAMPAFISASELSNISIRLLDSPMTLPIDAAVLGQRAEDAARAAVSLFGGLWIDRDDWLDRLAFKHRSGSLSDEMSLQIFRFVRDGFLILPGAVPANVVKAVNADINRFWKSPPEGLTVETFEPDGLMRLAVPHPDLRSGRTKMLDLYVHSRAARKAVAAPAVMEFLSVIFEDQPKAFQGLNFWQGSQQAIHKDTAYVKIDSNPMSLCATWLALEDVSPGTGELEYFVGSHRSPDYLFGGYSKWMEGHAGEHEQFLHSLQTDADTYGQTKASFLPRAGDVLIWHADLAHGGSPISAPHRTRKSLVTHFTASADEPFYRRHSQHALLDEFDCLFVSQYGDVQA